MNQGELRITLAQVEHVGWDGVLQLEVVRRMLHALPKGSTDIILLPELCPGIIDPISELASHLQTTIVAGGARRNENGDIVNRSLVFPSTGKSIAEYIKCFITPDELAAGYVPGQSSTVFEVKGHRVGLLICGDVGLGVESLLAMAHLDVELILVSAASQIDSLEYWRWHLVVKTLDTGIPICMVNYGGRFEESTGASGGGKSMLVSPLPMTTNSLSLDGFLKEGSHHPNEHILLELGEQPAIETIPLDLDRLSVVRREMLNFRKQGLNLLTRETKRTIRG